MSTVNLICKNIPGVDSVVATPENSKTYRVPTSAMGDYIGTIAFDCSSCGEVHTNKVPLAYLEILEKRGWQSTMVLPGPLVGEVNFAAMFGRGESMNLGNGIVQLKALDPEEYLPVAERLKNGIFTVPAHVAAREQASREERQARLNDEVA